MKVSEHRLMDTLAQVCAASETLTATVDREGPLEPCLARSAKRREIFTALMHDSGWRTKTTPFELKSGLEGRNASAFWQGAGPPKFLFGCHVDYCAGEGANDNASGMAVLAELGRHLAGTEAARFCRFAGFDMEERGLLGSRAHVQRKDVVMPAYMINVDAVGGKDLFVLQHTKKNDELVTQLWETAEDIGGIVHPIDATQIKISSDHIPFWDKGVAATTLIGYAPEAHAVLAGNDPPDEAHKKISALSTANKPTDLRSALDITNMVFAVRLLLQWVANGR